MSKRIRILFVSHSASKTGAPISLLNLVKNLDRGRISPRVVMPSDGSIYEEFLQEGIPVHLIKRIKYSRKDVYRIAWLAVRDRVSLVHVNSIEGWAGTLAASLVKRPCIWQIHEMLDSYVTEKVKYLQRADRIVAVSRACAKALSEFVPPGRVEVIYNGVEASKFSKGNAEKIFQEFQLADDTPVILAVGSVFPAKGYLYLMQAAAKVLKEFPQAKFLVVGDLYEKYAEYHKELRSFCREAGIENSVFFAGFRNDVIDFLAAARAVVSPSLAESLPLNMIEAAAAGKPIVAADVGGVAEVIVDKQTGLLVPPGDTDSLALALLQLLRYPEQALTYGRNGHERVRRLFSAELTARSFMELYESMLR